MRRTLTIAVAAVSCTLCASGQFRPPRQEMPPQVLFYHAFPVPADGDSARGRIDLQYRIDREFFVPVRDPEEHTPFHRSGEVVVEIADSTGETAARAMHALEIPEESADRKPMGVEWEQGIFSLSVPPGKFRVLITVDDQESRRTIMDSSTFVRVPRTGASGLETASLTLIEPPTLSAGTPGDVALMNYGDEILFGHPASLLVAWRDGTGTDTPLTVKYTITEEPPAAEDTSLIPPEATVTVPVYHGVQFVPSTDSTHAQYALSPSPGGRACAAIVPVPFARLLLRAYRFTYVLTSGTDRHEITRKGRAVWPDMPFSLKDIDNALEALRYITTEAGLDSLRRGNIEARRAQLEGFWRAHGEKQGTAFNDVMTEYYRRVDHATRSFGTLRIPDGFRSDRGRVYVLYGPPTETDRTLDPRTGHQEVWTYTRQKKKFIFVDQSKSGNYVLVSTSSI